MKRLFVLLWTHPLLLIKKLIARLLIVLNIPRHPVSKNYNGFAFTFDVAFSPVMRDLYYGMYEHDTFTIMKRFLKKGDTFFDIGANIGYFTARAAGFVGTEGNIHAFEPVPEYYRYLRDAARNNSCFSVNANQLALSDHAGHVTLYTSKKNIGWNTAVQGGLQSDIKNIIKIPTITLDEYTKKNNIARIHVMKIDTEGYEFPVLKGGYHFFRSVDHKPLIICEISPQYYSLLGISTSDVEEYMQNFGYRSYRTDNIRKSINLASIQRTTNIVFMHGHQ
ncbi:MAG: FkbM family methyltransferase [Elusimicrobia bacterium]|nr:FkbM family methyltransferase [Elusimicrobiota bacterium]MBD3412740.1 FkbM family methyltransferase [Elusimicrobiota bacterium]